MPTTSKKGERDMATRLAPYQLDPLRTATEWLPEPPLAFASGNHHPDPKVGIALYGPRSFGTSRHKHEVHIGFIGTSEAVADAHDFYQRCADGVAGDDQHTSFPGCHADRGYRCELRTDPQVIELLTRQEAVQLLQIRRARERFETLLTMLESKLALLCGRDHPLDYVVVALPHDLYTACRVVEYVDRQHGRVHRDLRRAFKALAMQYHKPTQIFLQTTAGRTPTRRQLDHPSVIAWNLFNGVYFKVDGLPWGPVGLPPASCYIGVSFYRPLAEPASTLRTSVVQAFDENGEGLVLRGHNFHWDEDRAGRSPHLPADQATHVVDMVLDRYHQERKQLPQRVVLHKTSRFEPDERAGFEHALAKVGRYDLVALRDTSDVRLIRAGQYPPLRGTMFQAGDVSYLYTSGYLAHLGRYPHGHVPSPLQVADHVGDTARADLLRELMVLTKMNWNSANPSGLLPITLRFARLVGDILREVPPGQTPQPKYRYYM
jgi:hypothetical protein